MNKKIITFSLLIAATIYLPIHSSFMFYDQTGSLTPARILNSADTAINMNTDTLLMGGDDSQAFFAFITQDPATGSYLLSSGSIKPKNEVFRTLHQAQQAAIDYLDQRTEYEQQRENEKRRAMLEKVRVRAASNPSRTGGTRNTSRPARKSPSARA